jgi:BlaI family transcriptional regulator, penicillinase repressor
MPAEQRKRAPLSDAEWEIMKVLWRDGAMALGDICEHLPLTQEWAYSTVRTFVQRLVQKGWLKATRVGNSHLYSPAVAQQAAQKSAIRHFADRVMDGVLSPFLSYYADDKGLTDEDIEEMERIVREHKKKKRKAT